MKLVYHSRKKASTAKPKKEEILDATLKVMDRKGFHATRMTDITNEVGVSSGLIYYHFKTKEDLFETIIDTYFEDTFKRVDEIARSDQRAEEKLYQFTLDFFENYEKQSKLVRIITSEVTRSPTIAKAKHLSRFLELQSRVRNVIEEGQEQGTIRSDIKASHLAYIFMGSVDAFMSAMVAGKKKIRNGAHKMNIANSIYSVLMKGIQIQGSDEIE